MNNIVQSSAVRGISVSLGVTHYNGQSSIFIQIASHVELSVIKARSVCVVTKNSLSQLLNRASPSLLHGHPIESSVIVGHSPNYYHAHGSPGFYRSIYPLSPAVTSTYTQAHIKHTTQALPITVGEQQMSSRFNLDRRKREGVSTKGRKRTVVWTAVGGVLLLRRGMIFVLLYVPGLYLTWS